VQLFLDLEAWLQLRIPGFNNYESDIAVLVGSGGQAITAIYFVGSALRARRYLSGNADSESGTSGSVANKAAMHRLMSRVLASGCLMLINTIVYGAGEYLAFNPVGYTVVFTIISLISIANSILQLASFAPPAGAPAGPIEEARLALERAVRSAVGRCDGSARAQSQRYGYKRLRFLIGEGPEPVTNHAAGGSRGGRRLSLVPRTAGGGVQSVAVVPEEPTNTGPSQSSLQPCERLGVSYEFLLAVFESWAVPPTMTTDEFCSKYIKPAAVKKNCCFTDLLLQTGCPEEWLGETDVFVTHWWGYRFADMVSHTQSK
jgi:hypothetical protein